MEPYQLANRELWDEWAGVHARSAFYDVEGFKAGKNSLFPLEQVELGDVSGKTLLHLQCHFGMDTLSWARLGARVTGADLSERAIGLAQSLSQQTGIPGTFVASDIYRLPEALDEVFDIVYTSYGVLCWLPDITRWARVAAHFVRPGGMFYIADFHPFANIFNNEAGAPIFEVKQDYFDDQPMVYKPGCSYADWETPTQAPAAYEWLHTLGGIVTALLDAGLRLEYLHEFPFNYYQQMAYLEKHADGAYWLPAKTPQIPMMFSIKAHKD